MRLFIITFICFSLSALKAQDISPFVVHGKFKIEDGSIDNAKIIVKKDGEQVNIVNSESKFEFKLDIGYEYHLEFTKESYVHKTIFINTNSPVERAKDAFAPFEFTVTLFPQKNDASLEFDQPIAMVKYFPELDDFSFDTNYAMSAQPKESEDVVPIADDPIPTPQNIDKLDGMNLNPVTENSSADIIEKNIKTDTPPTVEAPHPGNDRIVEDKNEVPSRGQNDEEAYRNHRGKDSTHIMNGRGPGKIKNTGKKPKPKDHSPNELANQNDSPNRGQNDEEAFRNYRDTLGSMNSVAPKTTKLPRSNKQLKLKPDFEGQENPDLIVEDIQPEDDKGPNRNSRGQKAFRNFRPKGSNKISKDPFKVAPTFGQDSKTIIDPTVHSDDRHKLTKVEKDSSLIQRANGILGGDQKRTKVTPILGEDNDGTLNRGNAAEVATRNEVDPTQKPSSKAKGQLQHDPNNKELAQSIFGADDRTDDTVFPGALNDEVFFDRKEQQFEENNKEILIITINRNGKETIFKRVRMKWGGVFYFKNNMPEGYHSWSKGSNATM
ncbi:MAG: hypothetical protein MRY83_03580 [Flavobacteriales bacterium]|nr:hypothetical protein [Flavobacteriales bacterium]